ncbi:MAG: FeoA domain-containing protein [Sporomusaceae bacterium]|nr:FeoA domain-containing protein [Sporomusaceae bacterium]
MKRRIVDMGLVAGTAVRVQEFAPLGDPMEVKVKNFNLSLRKTEAALIEIETS